MSLTNEQKAIVQSTLGQVADADQLAARFYDRLFAIDSSTKTLFRGDMAEQRIKLMQTIAVVVANLDDLSTIVPAIQSLGKRHVAYGVTIEHWNSVGSALLWALSDAFGEAFTDEVRDAWATAYGLIAQTAIAAAYPQPEEN
ncbi:MAG: hemin receptor [Anaerolineae bacterium]|nr:hemin receptor [Anaerolineae bacterium]